MVKNEMQDTYLLLAELFCYVVLMSSVWCPMLLLLFKVFLLQFSYFKTTTTTTANNPANLQLHSFNNKLKACYELKHDETQSTLFYLQDNILTVTPKYKTEIRYRFPIFIQIQISNIQLNTGLQRVRNVFFLLNTDISSALVAVDLLNENLWINGCVHRQIHPGKVVSL